jgi:hypothetical protein
MLGKNDWTLCKISATLYNPAWIRRRLFSLAIEALTDPSFFSLNVIPESREKKCFRPAVYNAKKILSTEYQLIGFSVCVWLWAFVLDVHIGTVISK